MYSEFSNGKKHGHETTWYPNGNIKSATTYINNQKTGIMKMATFLLFVITPKTICQLVTIENIIL